VDERGQASGHPIRAATHLQEDLQDATGLLIDQARDTLDTTTAGQAADGGLGDALDVVAEHLPVRKKSEVKSRGECC